MRFNIAYLGPTRLFHLRRDFILVMKYSLEDLGHEVILSGATIEPSCFNLVIGGYFLSPDQMKHLDTSGAEFAHVNTEVIGNDLLNFKPNKVDFLGAYLPSLQRGRFVWDVIMDNMGEHARYGTSAHFLRWGWHSKIRDIEHRAEKELDVYFFGMLSQRRLEILKKIGEAGIRGATDHDCPYFLRNDRISRAKVQLNLIQEDVFTHVNSFRICYLANNACCILSESERDPAGYLKYADIISPTELIDRIRYYIAKNRWKDRGDKALADFREYDMKYLMEELVDKSFA